VARRHPEVEAAEFEAEQPELASLPLVATEVGRRTLVVGDRQVPLFAAGGAPAHLVLSVRR
jgi:hypothetical protein